MKIPTINNKSYRRFNVSEDPSIFNGYIDDYSIDIELLRKIAKELGFTYDLYGTLYAIDKEAASAMVKSMCNQRKLSEIVFLLEDEEKRVLNYSIDAERFPLLNSEFIHRSTSLAETSEEIILSEVHYHKDDTVSSVIIKKKEPIKVEDKYINRESDFTDYHIGVLIVNDEINAAYTRLVIYVDGQPLYLPASYYNTTTSRYRRSTANSSEALEVLILRVIDDLRDSALYEKIYDFHRKYRVSKDVLASYEEYNTVMRFMRKIPTIIEDPSAMEKLLLRYEDFEKKYARVEDQKSSFIWRCTALSDITVGALVSLASNILSDVSAPAIEYMTIRDLLGSYISTNRIAEEIAKETI